MDRIIELFEQLTLPAIARVLRQAALASIAVAIVALVVSVVVSHILIGVGVIAGLGLGIANIRLVVHAVTKVSADHPERPRRVLASKSLYRLLATTAVVIGLLFVSTQLGFGVLGGIAIYYFVLLVSLVRSILQNGAHGVPA